MYDLAHKESIKKILRNCVRQNVLLKDHRDSPKNNTEVGKSDLTNSENLEGLLWHKVEGGDKNLENYFQNAA